MSSNIGTISFPPVKIEWEEATPHLRWKATTLQERYTFGEYKLQQKFVLRNSEVILGARWKDVEQVPTYTSDIE